MRWAVSKVGPWAAVLVGQLVVLKVVQKADQLEKLGSKMVGLLDWLGWSLVDNLAFLKVVLSVVPSVVLMVDSTAFLRADQWAAW